MIKINAQTLFQIIAAHGIFGFENTIQLNVVKEKFAIEDWQVFECASEECLITVSLSREQANNLREQVDGNHVYHWANPDLNMIKTFTHNPQFIEQAKHINVSPSWLEFPSR